MIEINQQILIAHDSKEDISKFRKKFCQIIDEKMNNMSLETDIDKKIYNKQKKRLHDHLVVIQQILRQAIKLQNEDEIDSKNKELYEKNNFIKSQDEVIKKIEHENEQAILEYDKLCRQSNINRKNILQKIQQAKLDINQNSQQNLTTVAFVNKNKPKKCHVDKFLEHIIKSKTTMQEKTYKIISLECQAIKIKIDHLLWQVENNLANQK